MNNPYPIYPQAIGRFKSKYEALHEINEVQRANYKSLEELENASKKLEELDARLAAAEAEIDDKLIKTSDDLMKLDDISKIDKELDEAKKDIQDRIADKKAEPVDPEREKRRQELEEELRQLNEQKKQLDNVNKEKQQLDASVAQGVGNFDNLSVTLSGKVSPQDMANAAAQMDKGYDEAISDLSSIVTGDSSTEYIEAWARYQFGDQLYDAASAIKNGASDAISGVNEFMQLGDVFGGSWRDPSTAAKKIETGLKNINNAVNKVNAITNNLFSAVTGRDSVILGKLDNLNNMGVNSLGSLAGAASIGIGSFNAFKEGNISAGISGVKDTINSIRGTYLDFRSKDIKNKIEENELGGYEPNPDPTENTDGNGSQAKNTGKEEGKDEKTQTGQSDPNEQKNSSEKKSGTQTQTQGGNYSADMIHEIEVVLEGCPSSQNSCCVINGENYVLSGYSLSQELLRPMLLSFSLEKEDKTETQQDVVFANITQLIGKSLEINVSTIKASQDDEEANPQVAFVFKGMIIDVSASRATASAQSASITVATWDALLQNVPHCRSFENMTLKEIIDTVLEPYRDIKSIVSPRFKDKIPYIVQYDQSDYAFISMLAMRFGEWMYNTGDTFVFGELDIEDSSAANLEYPGGSLMSYSLHQNVTSFSFSHLLPDYYQYGKGKDILKTSAQGMADGTVNDWTDKAYNASIQRFQDEQTVALKAGGFDSGKEDEGADAILDYSLKVEAEGKKTGIMTVQGFSKLAMLKIGQTFLIRDNVQNKSGESKDVEQKSLKVIGINHSFDYRQEYSNSFMAIPVACDYPSYSDADVFASAPQQRAKVVENKDEQMLGRVRVQFPWQEIQDKDMKTPWLRIAVPYAGQSKGQQFVPEIGEEVMVGFEMNNAERPYIIGSFYNGGTGKPDEAWAVSQEKDGTSNNVKAIRTRNGHTILFNDKGEAGLIEIYDNKNNTYHITLSADDKKITIYSAGEVEVVADTDVNINAKGNIGINADGNIGIKSKGNISMEAEREVSIQASKVKVR